MIPGGAVGAIHRLAWADNEAEARDLIVEAIQRGADVEEALTALNLWRQVQAHRAWRAGFRTEVET